jgi:glycosyltransferase involved in cell wall biosynthesis
MQITATIITLNEEANIQDCIRSAQRVCDEVLVVDSLSTDATVSIAESLGARVLRQAYLGDGPQKAFAVPYAKNDWILSLDADERLDEDCVSEMRKLDLSKIDKTYSFKRKNFVGDKWIKAAGFYPDRVIRLYNRQTAKYLPKKAHSKVTGASIIHLKGHILHQTYKDYRHWAQRINELSTRDAWAKYEQGKRCTEAGAAPRAVFALFKKLVLKRGLIQGADGWLVAMTTMFHVYWKYMKLAELTKDSTRDN